MGVSDIQNVTVLGAGSMGHGIAEIAAIAGYDVVLRDIERDYVDDGLEQIEWSLGKLEEKGRIEESADDVNARIEGEVDLETATENADLVVEAIPEDLDLKKDTFAEVDEYAPEDAIFASNTSGLSITAIGAATDRPEQVVGAHFFNPPVKMDLVEVVHGELTSEETLDAIHGFVDDLDKRAIDVKRDVHGFIVNNVMLPFIEEAAWMLSGDETTIQQADAAMVYQRGYPMGPFELADYTGIDIAYHFREDTDLDSPPAIAEKVEAEDLGKKTGQGFYDWESEGPNYEPGDGEGFDWLRVEARMVNEAAKLVGGDVATPDDVDLGSRLGARFPEGVCRLGDQLGLDKVLDKLRTLHEETGSERFAPDDYLVELVESGHTGVDAGRGFHDYGGDGPYQYINKGLTERGVLEIEFDRPERLNAFSETMFGEVKEALDNADVEDVSCVVFSGAGQAFSSGADITGFMAAEPTELMDVDETIQAIDEFERPTLAAIDGFCLGAGFEIALACDLRIATEDSSLGAPEINLGLIPGGGGTQRLTRIVGEGRAKELVFRGEQISAERAADWGLLNRAVSEAEFDETVEEFVGDLANGPKTALKVAKRVIDDGQDASLQAGLDSESQAFGLLTTTDDMVEGVTAFRDDREPEFE
ncbi:MULTISPECIES: 3-hydroxyacyl-CoA dehydrogenase/enoyl-CoA hydratase family protein [Halobacterium]|uniref:3-hydroxyacyl-CoA dehydrogenase/enoyl-CoA hydratase family protein n=1 Tax=Halobacterium TaxID=2239 RepID=UPI00073E79FA|nr:MULTISPECIES: 3-hydroxyacyl-CoA dehydrogenase NAD-binding domain-containing protein [Halobacterium]MCG1003264.1 3-hydroxyacyl-CoA dehydrogenase NAD-binding domain-containing protein [Halobacterium noricense]